jgi:hypothetical protein
MPPKKKKVTNKDGNPMAWHLSLTRDMLYTDVVEGRINTSPPVKDAHKARPEYMLYIEVKFEEYLQTMLDHVANKMSRAERDSKAVTQFLKINPPKATNHRGEPRWEGSAAEAMLKVDIDKGNYKKGKPIQLWATRPEYRVYLLKTFRDHIHQEVRARKFQAYVKNKSDQKWKESNL